MARAASTPDIRLAGKAPAPARVQCRRRAAGPTRDPWEEEAEEIAAWLARTRAGPEPAAPSLDRRIHPIKPESAPWGTAVQPALAARAVQLPSQPLEPALRADFERQLGRDLGEVRIHAGEAAAELSRELGAEAFTLGQHIVTTSTNRALLAHEVVHTVQQSGQPAAAPGATPRVQRKMRTAAELDPKVEELIKGHLERDRDPRVDPELDKVAAEIRDPKSWWSELRADLEPVVANPTIEPKVLERTKTACVTIRQEYGSRDKTLAQPGKNQMQGDPIQNAVAGLLTDYLRRNGELEAAAEVVRQFGWVKTYLPAAEIVAAMNTAENWEKLGHIALAQVSFAHPSLAKVWPGSVQAAMTRFLRLPPTRKFDRDRRKIAADLKVDPPTPSYLRYNAGADLFSEAIDVTKEPDFNELAGISYLAVFYVRRHLGEILAKDAAQIAELGKRQSAESPISRWRHIVTEFSTWRDAEATSTHALQRALADALRAPIVAEQAFWSSAGQLAAWDANELQERVMERLLQTGWSLTEAMLQEQPKVLELVDSIAPKLAIAADAFLTVRTPDELKQDERFQLQWLLAPYPEKAKTFAEFLIREVEPPIIAALVEARRAGGAPSKPGKEPLTSAEAFAWLGAKINDLTALLQAAASGGSGEEHFINLFYTRRLAAGVLADLAFAASGKAEAERVAARTSGAPAPTAASGTSAPAPAPSTSPFAQREGAKIWATIHDRAMAALEQRDLQTSVLLFHEDIRESGDHSLQQLDRDLEDTTLNTPIGGFEPFTTNDVLYLIHRRYYTNLLMALGPELLDAEKKGAARTDADLWISSRAIERAEKGAGSPRRYYVPNADVYYWEGDHPDVLDSLLGWHPKHEAWWTPLKAKHASLFRRRWTPDAGDFWIWVYPKPTELLASLYALPVLRGLVQMVRDEDTASLQAVRYTTATGETRTRFTATEESLRLAAELGDQLAPTLPESAAYQWYSDLRKLENIEQILGGGRKADRDKDPEAFKQLQRDVSSAGAKARAGARASSEAMRIKAHEALREATTRDRAVVVELVAKQMAQYDRSNIGTEHVLSTALENIEVFRRMVQPRTPREQSLQLTALMVELSTQFRRIYGEEAVLLFLKAADLPIGYNQDMAYRFLHEALANLPHLHAARQPDPAKPARPPEEHAEGILLGNRFTATQLKPILTGAETLLREAIEPMQQSLYHFQWLFGITGSAGSQTLTSHMKGRTLTAAAAKGDKAEKELAPQFQNSGIGVKIVRVLEDFVYLPGPGNRINAQHDPHAMYLPGRLYLGSNLMDEDTWADSSKRESIPVAAKEDPLAAPPGKGAPARAPLTNPGAPEVKLVRIQLFDANGPITEEFDLTSHQIGGRSPGMVWLTHVVHMETIQAQLRQLAAVIEGFGEGLMFLVSLHPAGRVAVIIAEVARLVDQLVNDPDFLSELNAIRKDPGVMLEKLSDEVAKRLTPDGVFDLLLNGNFDAPGFVDRVTPKGKRSAKLSLAGKQGKGQRLLTRIRRLGAVTAMRLEDLQERVQRPVHTIEANLARHPNFSGLVAWMGTHAESLLAGKAGLERELLHHRIGGPIYEQFKLREERAKMTLPPAPAAASVEGFGDAAANFARPFEQSLEHASSFSLPSEIIPLPLAINALIDTLIRLAQRPKNLKFKAAALFIKALKEGSDQFGITPYVTNYLAGLVRHSVIDPNNLWRSKFLPVVRDQIEGTIHPAAEQMAGMMQHMPVVGDIMKEKGISPPSSAGLKAEVTADPELDALFESEEAESYIQGLKLPDTDEAAGASYHALRTLPDIAIQNLKQNPPANAPGSASPNPPAGGSPHLTPSHGELATARSVADAAGHKADGRPLPPSLRRSAERRFGHDFSHVRLSQGPQALRATVGQGADGVTQGSHIHLRPDLSPSSGRGERILDHELAHVLQKTAGSSGHGAAPRAPAGLRIRRHEESAADRMADRARHNTGGGRVSVEGAHRDGASPSLSANLLRTFLLKVADPAAAAKLTRAADRAHGPDTTGPDALDPAVEQLAKKIWTSFFAAIKAGGFKGAHPYLRTEATLKLIAAHLKKRVESVSDLSAASNIIAHLADNRQVTKRGKSKEKSLDASGFVDDLVLYLAGRSGVVLSVTNQKAVAATPGTAPTLSVAHLELHLVRATDESKQLWEIALKNTWATELAAATTADPLTKYRHATAALLEQDFGAPPPATASAGAPAPATPGTREKKEEPTGHAVTYSRAWDTSAADLTFDGDFKRRVEERLHPPSLELKYIPPWQVYVGKNRASNGPQSLQDAEKELAAVPAIAAADRSRAATIGMHLATHGELTSNFLLGANDRNSHHIVQYLLPEYFSNDKGFQPFPHATAYAGVEPAGGGKVTRIKNPSGGPPIEVGTTAGTKSGRGEPMPAINLSASTHLGSEADLHVTPTADDRGQASQGYSIHTVFQEQLINATKKASAADADAYLRLNPADPAAARAVFDAVRQTYAWIWKDQMRTALLKRMPKAEASYYLSQFPSSDAARWQRLQALHDNKVPDKSDIIAAMTARAEKAERFMLTGMEKLGWKLP